jgi:RIO kinase 1
VSNTNQPDWLVTEPFVDVELGVLRSGKEAQIEMIERIGTDKRSCILARKRYLPRSVKHKGELEDLGFQRASTFRNDVEYREGRQFRKSRDRRAVERMSAHGKQLLQARWTSLEYDVVSSLWAAGVTVPYPVSFGDDVFTLQYIGTAGGAAPQLAHARLDPTELAEASSQLVDGLAAIVAAGWVHGDLSAYNLLWWDERLWFIDFPQAVDLAANPQGLNYLHRDVANIADWFTRRGHPLDAEELFAELLTAWIP